MSDSATPTSPACRCIVPSGKVQLRHWQIRRWRGKRTPQRIRWPKSEWSSRLGPELVLRVIHQKVIFGTNLTLQNERKPITPEKRHLGNYKTKLMLFLFFNWILPQAIYHKSLFKQQRSINRWIGPTKFNAEHRRRDPKGANRVRNAQNCDQNHAEHCGHVILQSVRQQHIQLISKTNCNWTDQILTEHDNSVR